MAHNTLIDGTAYEVSGGRTLVDGTGYDIDKGNTLVDGTGYEIGFGVSYTETVTTVSHVPNLKSTGTVYLGTGYKIVDGKYVLKSARSYRVSSYKGKSIVTLSSGGVRYAMIDTDEGDVMYKMEYSGGSQVYKYICIGLYDIEEDSYYSLALCRGTPSTDYEELIGVKSIPKMTITIN